ncbi:FecR domain-containing protein [Paludibacterium purpuratum]|uniref:FecR family protein n=1 Tax=Paludibacterium purpuratum TaxID=1144873 RepID=A0A4R7B7D7_9NEIS|nr:FecR domain-containing protein [Paludibacterium purpuratum]TDR80618.1 FecR family protein [Paludibacterium purpuratum]
MPTTPDRKKTILPEWLGRVVCLAALAMVSVHASGAATCAFDAHGRQIAPAIEPTAVDPHTGHNWGGIGGTGIRTASAVAKPGQDDGWGGIGGTGVKHAAPLPAGLVADRGTATEHEGWGGIGGTGISHTPAGGQSHLAGYVLFASGQTMARQGELPARMLARGDAICEGDAVATQAGMLQIRMADQGSVMLYSGSKLHIDTFNLPAKIDGSERLAMTLTEGGMRAMTGEIGHVNKANYLIQTPAAQIHIRGTDHQVFHVPAAVGRFGNVAPGTYNHVISGGTTMLNGAGSVRLEPAQSGFIPLNNGQPHVIEALPEVLRTLPLRGALRATGTSSTGKTDSADAGITSPLDPLTAMPDRIVSNSVALDFNVDPVDSPAMSAYVGATLSGGNVALGAIDGNTDEAWRIGVDPRYGIPLYAVTANPSTDWQLLFFVDDDTVQPVQFQSTEHDLDGAKVYWGIYYGGASSDINGDWQYADAHAYAFAPGGSTPLSVIQAMTGSLTYSTVVGSTAPIDENASAGGRLNSLSMGVRFDGNPQVTSYNINVTDGQNRVWNASATGSVSLAGFKNGQMQLSGGCTGCQSSTITATGTAAGVLIGQHAGGAITSYTLQTNQPDQNQSVSGVAVLKH